MKKLNNKGFTLIEMVIVIVIIAILAAMLVPSLLSYVNNANQKSFLTACDSIKTSSLTSMTNQAAKGEEFAPVQADVQDLVGNGVTISYTSNSTTSASKAGAKNTYNVNYKVESNKLTYFSVASNKYVGVFSANNWTVADAT